MSLNAINIGHVVKQPVDIYPVWDPDDVYSAIVRSVIWVKDRRIGDVEIDTSGYGCEFECDILFGGVRRFIRLDRDIATRLPCTALLIETTSSELIINIATIIKAKNFFLIFIDGNPLD
jgi:hypothetical protein